VSGVVYAMLAYGSWGIFPLYWKLFGDVPPVEIVCHRVVWSVVFLAILVLVLRQVDDLVKLLGAPKKVAALLGSATLLSLNWGIFVYAVNSGQIVETSLGYFIVPLVNVLLGVWLLRERLSRLEIVAFAFAVLGVVAYGSDLGRVPWIALGLAFTFGFYGLVRKVLKVPPLVGIFAETALMTPVALLLIGFLHLQVSSAFLESGFVRALFLCSGIITALPLLWFNSAAKLLPLSTMGFFQYLAPFLQLLVGIFVYHEEFPFHKLAAFALIWVAIALYLRSALRPSPVVPLAD